MGLEVVTLVDLVLFMLYGLHPFTKRNYHPPPRVQRKLGGVVGLFESAGLLVQTPPIRPPKQKEKAEDYENCHPDKQMKEARKEDRARDQWKKSIKGYDKFVDEEAEEGSGSEDEVRATSITTIE